MTRDELIREIDGALVEDRALHISVDSFEALESLRDMLSTLLEQYDSAECGPIMFEWWGLTEDGAGIRGSVEVEL